MYNRSSASSITVTIALVKNSKCPPGGQAYYGLAHGYRWPAAGGSYYESASLSPNQNFS